MTVAVPETPYRGLAPFGDSDVDALLFFGREHDREVVVANMLASRLTVLYGASGVGKSSLLRAGVARDLRALPEAPLVVVFSAWSGDATAALSGAVAEAAGVEPADTLAGTLERAQAARGEVFLILDQAEELFLYHPDGEPFASALADALAARLRVSVLLSLRDDALAQLDRLKARIPNILGNYLRLDRLDRRAGAAAITGPLDRLRALGGPAVTAEPELVEEVLDQVAAGGMDRDPSEPGLNGGAARVETPYLQLVMQRLWDVERERGSPNLRVATLAELGGASTIVADHLQHAMDALSEADRVLAARLFRLLVTPSGTKIAHRPLDLAAYTRTATGDVERVLDRLCEHRILRPVEGGRFEIYHDVLAAEVLAWGARHEAAAAVERAHAEARRRHRRLAFVAASALLLAAALAGLAVWALAQRAEARERADEAKARELEASSRSLLASDPELALLLAREAALLSPGPQSEGVLRDALRQSRLRAVVEAGGPLVFAGLLEGAVTAVRRDGRVVRADPATGEVRETAAATDGARYAALGSDGRLLVVDGRGRVVLDALGARRALPRVTRARSAAVSPDGALVAVVRTDDTASLVDARTGAVVSRLDTAGPVKAVAFSAAGRLLATGGERLVRLWRPGAARPIQKLRGFEGQVRAVAFSPRGTLVAAVSSDGTGQVWHTADGRVEGALVGHVGSVGSVSFSPDGRQVATGSVDRTARTWRDERGIPLLTFAGHDATVSSAVFGEGERQLVTASEDGTAGVWDALVLPESEELARLPEPAARAEWDGPSRVRAGAGDETVRTLAYPEGDELGTRPGALAPPPAVAPGGRRATIEGDVVALTGGGLPPRTLSGHTDAVTSAAFSPDGSRVVTASRDHDARTWDSRTGRPLHVLRAHFGAVAEARYSPDGRWIVTAGPGTAGLFHADTGAFELFVRGHDGPLTSASFDPASRVVLSSGRDGTVRTWRCEVCGTTAELLEAAKRRLDATGRRLTVEERARYVG